MSRYGQYGYYDPVGSNQPQPTGYTYQSTSNAPSYPSAAASSGYGSNQPSYSNTGYSAQSYGNNAQQGSSATTHAAAALSSLGNQDYNQAQSRTGQYDNPQWYGSSSSTSYGSTNLQPPNRSQANTSPLYASAQGSTFGRLSVPDQTQSTSSTYGSASTYQNAPSSAGTNYRYQSNNNQAAQHQPPQRYNSPLHAVQAQQQSHQKQSSRGSNPQPSPQMANARYSQQNRQQSASVERSPTTVDPSQVYDNRAELERKARFDAERRKGMEAEQAAKKAEEDRVAAERREVEEANQKAAEAAEAAKKKEQQDRKNEQRRKAREEKRQSKSAATTLQQMASMVAEGSGAGDDEEAEMRAMFKKMREFNSKNPAMLAKLWEEERKQHSESQSPQGEKATPGTPATRTAHARQLSGTASQAQQRPTAQPTKVPPKHAVTQQAAQQTKTAAPSQASPIAASSRPAASSASNSLWPPHKKGALADATAKWLMGLPENAGKTISQQAVLNILNTNPSYVQLCESLENLDMRFERSTLARELLKAVPDGLRTQPHPKPSTPVATNGTGMSTSANRDATQASQSTPQPLTARPQASSGSGTVSYDAPLSLSDAAREVNDMHKSARPQYGGTAQQSQQSPYLSQSQTLASGSRPPSQARAPSQSQPPEVKTEVKPEEPPRPPANKEEAARKRTFGDLVDLTKDDDSDDDGPPHKKSLPATGMLPSNDGPAQFRDPLGYLQRQPPPQPYKPYSYQPRTQVPGTGIMQSGQRPQPILPSNGQQQQPAQISMPPKPKGPSAEQLQQSRMRGRMLVEPIMRDRVARKSRYDSSTIARDVLLATGRHPDMRGLNSHLNNMQKLLGHHGGEVDTAGTKCDLSTIKWDILDPEQPKESLEKKDGDIRAADTAPAQTESPSAPAPTAPMGTTVDYEAPFSSAGMLGGPPVKEKKKRGRKPRVSMPDPSLGDRASPNTPARAATTNNTPDHAIDPTLLAHANEMAAQGTPVGYSAFRQIGPDGQVIKKKGRPVGWRKNVHSREAQGLPAYPKPPKDPSKLGRPPKEAKEKDLVRPQWQSYHCGWKDCKAELINLDTLKKHLVKVHGRELDGGRGYQCLWRDCDRQPGEGGGFTDIEPWMSHVDYEHLQPIAWKQGDGPTGGSLGESPSYRRSATPAYLNDVYGRSVTPVISEPTPPPQTQTAQPASTFSAEIPKRIGRPPKDGIPRLERDAGAELKKLEEHKAVVGPTMDRQGCVLVSEERRRTFLGDEDFEDELDASEDEGRGLWG